MDVEFKKVVSWFQICFHKICEKYDLRVEPTKYDRLALVGDRYALEFSFHLGDTYVEYIRRNERGNLESWDLDMHLRCAGKDLDVEKVFCEETVYDVWKNAVFWYSRVLDQGFEELLSGGTEWMSEYLGKWYAEVRDRRLSIVEELWGRLL